MHIVITHVPPNRLYCAKDGILHYLSKTLSLKAKDKKCVTKPKSTSRR